MGYIQFEHAVRNKIDDAVSKNSEIISRSIELSNKDTTLCITLEYNGFSVIMNYSAERCLGYSFMETNIFGNSLLTKFKFPFSDIPYSVYDIHNTVEDPYFETYEFHCLYNEKSVLNAVDTVISFINRNKAQIASISNNILLKDRLEESFSHDLRVASKKIKRENFEENLDENVDSNDVNLYFLRYGEEAFLDFITKNKVSKLQRFYSKNSKKDKLLTYEERYLEYLFQNDFGKKGSTAIESDVKKQVKISKSIELKDYFAVVISLALSFAVEFLTMNFVNSMLEKNYILLAAEDSVNFFALIICTAGFTCILYRPIEQIFSRIKIDYTPKMRTKKSYSIAVFIGLLLIASFTAYNYFYFQQNIGLGENDVYYCQELGKAEHISYDEMSFYLVGETGDEQIIAVRGNDYENYFSSDYLEIIELSESVKSELKFKGKFKTYDEFYEKFGIE